MGLEWMETKVSNVPDDLKDFVDSFRKGDELPKIKDILHLSIYDDERVDLLPKPMKALFNKYISSKEEELELCSSPLAHPDEKGAAKMASSHAYASFSNEMCKALHIEKNQKQEKRTPLDFSEDGELDKGKNLKL